ncbi:MAG: SLBB domain-containing protein [Pseudomonadota bacterium]
MYKPLALGLAMLLLLGGAPDARAQAQMQGQSSDNQEATAPASNGGPVRLRQPTQPSTDAEPDARPDSGQSESTPPVPGTRTDFELHVRKQPGGSNVQRLGVLLMEGLQRANEAADPNPLVPPDYVLGAGDVLVVTLWGSVDADLRLLVDRSGRISIPRVGPIMVSGVRYGDLPDVISRRVAQVFKNFQLSVSLGQLRGLRVYVTGFVNKPGPVSVSSLSTLTQAVTRAGGPSAAGSYRNIQLRRGRAVVTSFDLYDLLLRGDRSADQLLQPDDVIHVGPVGPQVALIGSVNRPAIYEIRASETIDDLLQMAGGFNAVADSQRLVLERMSVPNAERMTQINVGADRSMALRNGDLLRALNAADVQRPIGQQNKRVRIEGEVGKPGEYIMPPDSTLLDALGAAGGLTTNAYLYAAVLTRESVRVTQQQNYERALRDFETQITSAAATRRAGTPEEVTALTAANAANSRLLQQLRNLRPSGRIVLQLPTSAQTLPELVLEDGDRLNIPARPTTVGVFGSVFSTGSYLYSPSRTVGDYLRLAGGPTRGADSTSVFVIRANGSVNSSLQESGFFSRGNQIAALSAEPGDTIFVPEELDKTTWVQNAKDWTQILYQFGIGLAGIKSAVQ